MESLIDKLISAKNLLDEQEIPLKYRWLFRDGKWYTNVSGEWKEADEIDSTVILAED